MSQFWRTKTRQNYDEFMDVIRATSETESRHAQASNVSTFKQTVSLTHFLDRLITWEHVESIRSEYIWDNYDEYNLDTTMSTFWCKNTLQLARKIRPASTKKWMKTIDRQYVNLRTRSCKESNQKNDHSFSQTWFHKQVRVYNDWLKPSPQLNHRNSS